MTWESQGGPLDCSGHGGCSHSQQQQPWLQRWVEQHERPLRTKSLSSLVCPSCVFQVVAVYPFVARSHHEVSLQAGQPVTVLEAQDKKGNPEWSLVEVNGQRGYVPSSFLARVSSPASWGWSLPS